MPSPIDPSDSGQTPSALPSVSFQAENDAHEVDATETLSLEQVLTAGARDFQNSLGLGAEEVLDFEALGEVIHATQSAMTGHVSGTEEGSDPVASEAEGGDGLDAEYLAAVVGIFEDAGGATDLGSAGPDPFHQVSILLHAAHLHQGGSPETIGRSVDAVLREVDRTAAFYFIVRAVHDMAGELPHAEFDHWLPAALPALRRVATPLVDRLSELCCASTPHGKEALWPYAVDEMLVTLKGRRAGLDPRVHDLDQAALDRATERLVGLNALAGRRLASGMFTLDQTFAHGLLGALMKTAARSQVGPLIFTAFRESPPVDRGVSMCMFAHRQYSPDLDGLLAEQLKDLRAPVSAQAQCAAAWLLNGTIGSMAPARREETWVGQALSWLGERDSSQDSAAQRQGIEQLLTRVTKERDGLRRAWNKECRQAAKSSLSQLKSR